MDLWIRSQNRRALYCVRQLRINGLDIMCLGGELLGTYKSEERTLEVLDEIQKILKQNLMFHIDKSQCNIIEDIANPKFIIREIGIPRVYEMPLE